jgi:hypothetical protein
MVLCKCNYVFEPTGADSLSQNGAVEIYNNKLAVHTRTLLYGANLPEKYWSSTLLHAVYLNNQLVHLEMRKPPLRAFMGRSQTLRIWKCSGLGCVWNEPVTNKVKLIDMTLRVFFGVYGIRSQYLVSWFGIGHSERKSPCGVWWGLVYATT